MTLHPVRALAPAAAIIGALLALGTPLAAQDAPAAFVDEFDSFDRSRWYVSDGWSNGDWMNCTWSEDMLDLAGGVLKLGFQKRPYKDTDYSCAEVQTHERFGHGIYEARFKTAKGTGLNAAFFTYIGEVHDRPHDEIDFEVITKDTSQIELNTYVSGKPRNGKTVPVEGGTDTGFNDYAFVWDEGRIRWFVNGTIVHTAEGDDLPVNDQKIFFSFWSSDTFTEWMGPFEDPGEKLVMEVDRVAFTPLGAPCQFPESVACTLQ